MGKTFAYIRVSTREQKEDRQLDSLQGLKVDEIIIEKASGKNFVGREKYQQMKAQLRAGDLVIPLIGLEETINKSAMNGKHLLIWGLIFKSWICRF